MVMPGCADAYDSGDALGLSRPLGASFFASFPSDSPSAQMNRKPETRRPTMKNESAVQCATQSSRSGLTSLTRTGVDLFGRALTLCTF